MNSRKLGEEQEKFHLKQFKIKLPAFPKGNVEFCNNKQMPDMVVHAEEGDIGIEHTRLIWEEEWKRQERLQDVVMERAKEIYKSENHDSLQLYFLFNPHKPLNNKCVETIANQIALGVKDYVCYFKAHGLQPPEGLFETWRLKRAGVSAFPDAVTNLSLRVPLRNDIEFWTVARNSMVPRLTPEYLQEPIDRKNKKIGNYQGNYAQMWLLLVSQGSEPSSHFDLEFSCEAIEHTYKSHFDRVFLMESFSGTIIPLKITPIQLPPEGEGLLGSV